MEKIVTFRIQQALEGGVAGISPLHVAQAGFRRRRSCEEQISLLLQHILNGFEGKSEGRASPLKTLMVLIDFNRAFDTVLRDPTSPKRIFRHGLPQGACSSPILFLLFIDDMLSTLSEGEMACYLCVVYRAEGESVHDGTRCHEHDI